jgi:hypothetical protein
MADLFSPSTEDRSPSAEWTSRPAAIQSSRKLEYGRLGEALAARSREISCLVNHTASLNPHGEEARMRRLEP